MLNIFQRNKDSNISMDEEYDIFDEESRKKILLKIKKEREERERERKSNIFLKMNEFCSVLFW